MRHLLSDKFTLGGDASVAAGPIGRDMTAQTDAMMNSEILSYSPFAGFVRRDLAYRRDASAG